MYGNPLYDVIAYLRNWPEWQESDLGMPKKMRRRVEVLSEELGYDKKFRVVDNVIEHNCKEGLWCACTVKGIE